MKMKVAKAKLKNFAQFEDFECEFDQNITRLVGLNGAGKSTVGLKGIQACLCGISEQSGKGQLLGERFRFIGKNGKSADVEYQFEDNGKRFTISNHITAGSNSITFKNVSGDPIDDAWLKGFLNVALMSAKNFCSLTGREQAIALGIDTGSFDKEIKALKTDFTALNRELKAFGEIAIVEPVEPVDLTELKAKKDAIREKLNTAYMENRKHNTELRLAYEKAVKDEQKAEKDNEIKNAVLQAKINDATAAHQIIQDLGYEGKEVQTWLDGLERPEQRGAVAIEHPQYIEELPNDKELREIDEQIMGAHSINNQAAAYQAYLKKASDREAKAKELEANKTKQAEAEAARNAYISSFDFGFAGLTTDEDGCLLLKNRPLTDSYFSKGELEMIVAKLHASRNPVFKTRFIDDFDLLDEENQEKLIKDLIEAGFQVITAEVGKVATKENTLVLRECAIATDEIEKPELI
jgi:DNA repair exonuclease SbcCD ATPase subunit